MTTDTPMSARLSGRDLAHFEIPRCVTGVSELAIAPQLAGAR